MGKGTIRFENVTKSFRGKTALQEISFEITRGQRVGIIGPNGSGKTTLLNLLCGLLRPDSGAITFDGIPIQDSNFLLQAGILQDTGRFFLALTGAENVELFRRGPLLKHPQEAGNLLRQVGIADAAERAFRTYSHGMKQRLGLAVALLGYPDILVFDEPTNALDPKGIVEMRALLKSASRDAGTIIMCSHMLHEVELACDHIIVLKDGRLVTAFDLASMKTLRQNYLVRVAQVDESIKTLSQLPAIQLLRVEGNLLELKSASSQGYALLKQLMQAGVQCEEFTRKPTHLEEVFMDVIK